MPDTIVAREYLRVSRDATGRLASLSEQHADNERAAAAQGWTLGLPYAEMEAVSASRHSAKARAAFDRLCADITSGMFGAGVLVLWESSRGSRKVLEWAALIDACEQAGVLIHVTTHSRTYNPGNHRDRRSLHEDATDSEYESGKMSLRLRRAHAALAEAGKPSGRVPFGYTRTYDPVTRRFVSQDPEPQEAAIVAELYERLRRGDALNAIAADFAARGVRNRSGTPITGTGLRNMAVRPLYLGLRAHRSDGEVTTVRAVWPPLVTEETWHAVHAMLTDPARRTTRPGRGVHMLSMIARCAQCEGPMSARYRPSGVRDYACRERACIRITAGPLDDYAITVLAAYLSRPDILAALRAASGGSGGTAIEAVRAEMAKVSSELAGWRAQAAAGKVTPESFAAIEPGVVARLRKLQATERELSVPGQMTWLLESGEDVARMLAAAPVAARRQAARFFFSPAYIGTMLVGRVPSRGQHLVQPEKRVAWKRTLPVPPGTPPM